MKFFILLLVFAGPLLAEGAKDEKPQQEEKADSTRHEKNLEFTPLLPDSFSEGTLRTWMYPERNRFFQYKDGVVLVPDPQKIELNAGGVVLADPTVDLGIIYPLESRQRILLKKQVYEKEHPRSKLAVPRPPHDKSDEKAQETPKKE